MKTPDAGARYRLFLRRVRSPAVAFSLFLPRVFNRVSHCPRRVTKGNEGAAARGNGIDNPKNGG
jgi:hypothetical protein